jgi:hypothetical protein
MTKTLLDATNEILKRVGIVSGDAVVLTSLTDSARQRAIDVSVQVINEGIDELFSVSNKSLPLKQAEASITLSLGVRAYDLNAAVVKLRWPFIDKTNSQFLYQYAGGYNQMLIDDPEQDDTGLPHYAAVRDTDGKLYLDRAPTAADVARVYTYQYDREVGLDTAADTVPFNDAAFRAMVPAWVQLWKREMRNEFDTDLFKTNVGRAARLITSIQPRRSYNPRRRA